MSPLARSTYRKFQTRRVHQLEVLFDSGEILRQISDCGPDACAASPDAQAISPNACIVGDAFPPPSSEASAVASTVRECSVLVGLHPDQALDHIVAVRAHAISGHQWSSGAIRGHQWLSGAIRGHLW